MYSPSARLTELVSSYLGHFFQSVEKDHLQASEERDMVMRSGSHGPSLSPTHPSLPASDTHTPLPIHP